MAFYRVGITDFWWDQANIKLADSIPQSIDEGVRGSRYLLAVITKQYFAKHWTRKELDAMEILQRPVIPVCVGVSSDDVRNFSLALATRRAVEFSNNPEYVADEVSDLLGRDPETIFAKFAETREQQIAFWGMALLFVRAALGILAPDSRRRLAVLDKNREKVDLPSWKRHMESELNYTAAEIRNVRAKLPPLGDDDAALAIVALIKRSSNGWFPTYPEEIAALRRAGIETW
jgi:hypothetical protein